MDTSSCYRKHDPPTLSLKSILRISRAGSGEGSNAPSAASVTGGGGGGAAALPLPLLGFRSARGVVRG